MTRPSFWRRCDGAVLDDRGTGGPGALGQGLGNVRGVHLPVARQEGGTDQIVRIHDRPEVLRLFRGQELHFQPEGTGRGGLALDLGHALVVAGQAQAAVALPAGCLPGLGFQPVVKLDRVFQKLGDVGAAAQLADQAGGMKGRPAGQFGPFQQDHVLPAQPRQMVGRRAADNAATDDDGPGGLGELAHAPDSDKPDSMDENAS